MFQKEFGNYLYWILVDKDGGIEFISPDDEINIRT
jgi:hypothetical protein